MISQELQVFSRMIQYNLIIMGKKEICENKEHVPTKKIKKSRHKFAEPESEEPSQYSQEAQQQKKNSKSHKKHNKQAQDQQHQEKRIKTRSTEESVKLKIKNAFNEQQKQILQSMKKSGSDDELSDSEDENENDIQVESSVSSPLEEEEEQSSQNSHLDDSDHEWGVKGEKKSKRFENNFPGFHRKIQISYEILDKRNQDPKSSVQFEIDGKKAKKIDQNQILINLETMRKSIEKLQMIFRNQTKEKPAQKEEFSEDQMASLIEKYSRPREEVAQNAIATDEAGNEKINTEEAGNEEINDKDLENETKLKDEKKEEKGVKKKSRKRLEKEGEKRIMIE